MPKQASNSHFDKSQFETLFKMHFPFLCNFAVQYVEDPDTAQDICQQVFIALWERQKEIDPRKSVKSYLFTAVKNRCLNYIRDQKKYRSIILDIDCGDIEFSLEEEPFFQEELKEKIEKALNTLPEKCRKVFEMSRYRQLKYREIAEELGIAQKTVEAHMTRAIKCLREHLKDYLLIILIFAGWIP